jgi:hypothetical protein
MRVVARPTWEELEWGTPLARAHVRGALPTVLAPPRAVDAARRVPHDVALLAALGDEAPSTQRAAWDRLAAPGAAAVVTGQQPGCLGGPLLVLYKAATAVALARRLSRARRAPVVPVFWNATDDDDFDEVARVAWIGPGDRLDFVELPRRGHSGWVGDLPAALDVAAADSVLGTAPGAAVVPRTAADHGAWVAAFLGRLFPELAIVDGRSPALRRAAVPLFERYLDAADGIRTTIEAQAATLAAHGFDATLAPASLRLALHLTPDRRRAKLGEDWTPLRRALLEAPHIVSPNVVLRALVQDALLPTLAQVVGPSEIGYLVELRPARAALGVGEPALVPRATATLVPAALWEALAGRDIAPWLRDPAAALAAHADAQSPPPAELAAEFAALDRRLAELDRVPEAAQARLRRKLQGVRDDATAVWREAARAAWLEGHPALRGLETWLRPRNKPQERLLAGLWAVSRCGATAADDVAALADEHLDAVARGQGVHVVATLAPAA